MSSTEGQVNSILWNGDCYAKQPTSGEADIPINVVMGGSFVSDGVSQENSWTTITTQENQAKLIRDLYQEIESLKKVSSPPLEIWIPQVGDQVSYHVDYGNGDIHCLGQVTCVNFLGNEISDVMVDWYHDPKSVLPSTYIYFPDTKLKRATPVERLELELSKLQNRTFSVGSLVRYVGAYDSMGVITQAEGDYYQIDWKNGSNWGPQYGNQLEPFDQGEAFTRWKEVSDSHEQKQWEHQLKLDTLAAEKARLEQEVEDQKARSLDMESRFDYFLKRVEELEKKGEEDKALAEEIQRQELLPVVREMSKREKIKFFVKQLAKNVGREVLIKMAQNADISLQWLMKWITG